MRRIGMMGLALLVGCTVFGSGVLAEESETVNALEIRQARFTAMAMEAFGSDALAAQLRDLLKGKDVASIRRWMKKHQAAIREANLAFFGASVNAEVDRLAKREAVIRGALRKRVETSEKEEKKRATEEKKRQSDDKKRWGADEREDDDRRKGRGWGKNSDDEDDRDRGRGRGRGRGRDRDRDDGRKAVQDPDSKRRFPKFDQKFWDEMYRNPWGDSNRALWVQLVRNPKDRDKLFKKRGKPEGFDDYLDNIGREAAKWGRGRR